MARPAVQEVVSMGQVMEAAAPIQDSKAIRPDMVIKVIRAIKVVIIIRAISSNNSSRVTKATRSS